MAKRQPIEKDAIGPEIGDAGKRQQFADEIVLRQHHAFGIAGRAGRVMMVARSSGLSCRCGPSFSFTGTPGRSSALQETLPTIVIEDDAAIRPTRPRTSWIFASWAAFGHEDETHAGIVELKLDLAGVQRWRGAEPLPPPPTGSPCPRRAIRADSRSRSRHGPPFECRAIDRGGRPDSVHLIVVFVPTQIMVTARDPCNGRRRGGRNARLAR